MPYEADAVLDGIKHLGVLPSEIWLRDEGAVAALAPLAKAFGVRIARGKLKAIRQARKTLDDAMHRGLRP